MLDKIVTVDEYLLQQEQLEKEAFEVLPFDTTTCSLKESTQQIFSCLTCKSKDFVGVCYACHVSCHTSHNVIDLGQRRSFTCDCVKINCCSLSSKLIESSNKYDKCFNGNFCYCGKYSEDEECTMFQCDLCEDWIHDRCLDKREPSFDPDQHAFYICNKCITKHSFLSMYVTSEGTFRETSNHSIGFVRDVFLPDNYRKLLCRCENCNKLYSKHDLDYITKDQIQLDPRPQPKPSFDEVQEKVLSTVDRSLAIDGVLAYKELEQDLKSWLKTFVKQGKVVQSSDINEFFDNKRQKRQ